PRPRPGASDDHGRARGGEDDRRARGGSMMRAVWLVVLASACGPYLIAQSTPPPGRVASLERDGDEYDLQLTQGVAIAVSCDDHSPCKDVVVSTEDAAIADVKGAAFGTLERDPYLLDAAAPAGVVVIGKAPGKTRVKVKSSGGTKTIDVTVIRPPMTGEPATIARP
ncbi:MAG TPA: hypothetical protein VK427_02680, partial [Kofleriaceae bacterium]|nr:hypothetical protein [Kofleriaceae bacterium]